MGQQNSHKNEQIKTIRLPTMTGKGKARKSPGQSRLISLRGRTGHPEDWPAEQRAEGWPGGGETSRKRKRHLQGEIREVKRAQMAGAEAEAQRTGGSTGRAELERWLSWEALSQVLLMAMGGLRGYNQMGTSQRSHWLQFPELSRLYSISSGYYSMLPQSSLCISWAKKERSTMWLLLKDTKLLIKYKLNFIKYRS